MRQLGTSAKATALRLTRPKKSVRSYSDKTVANDSEKNVEIKQNVGYNCNNIILVNTMQLSGDAELGALGRDLQDSGNER